MMTSNIYCKTCPSHSIHLIKLLLNIKRGWVSQLNMLSDEKKNHITEEGRIPSTMNGFIICRDF
jgi:hypothetical protein